MLYKIRIIMILSSWVLLFLVAGCSNEQYSKGWYIHHQHALNKQNKYCIQHPGNWGTKCHGAAKAFLYLRSHPGEQTTKLLIYGPEGEVQN